MLEQNISTHTPLQEHSGLLYRDPIFLYIYSDPFTDCIVCIGSTNYFNVSFLRLFQRKNWTRKEWVAATGAWKAPVGARKAGIGENGAEACANQVCSYFAINLVRMYNLLSLADFSPKMYGFKTKFPCYHPVYVALRCRRHIFVSWLERGQDYAHVVYLLVHKNV